MASAGCALTVDVEEWFHICGVGGALAPARWSSLPSRVVGNTETLLEMLDRRSVTATFFVLGYVADRHPRLIEAIRAGGHEIGSHGHMHTRVYEMTPEAFASDLDDSLSTLAAAGAPPVTAYRAPEWSINDRSLWALDLLAARGVRVDSSMAPLRIVGNAGYEQEIHRRATARGLDHRVSADGLAPVGPERARRRLGAAHAITRRDDQRARGPNPRGTLFDPLGAPLGDRR